MAIVPEKQKDPDFKELWEVFSCDCQSRDHSLSAHLLDERMVILEMNDESILNIPVTWRLWKSLKVFWDMMWNHNHRIEIVLNQKEHKKFKAFFATLKDERCYDCNPDYLEGKGKYFEHGH